MLVFRSAHVKKGKWVFKVLDGLFRFDRAEEVTRVVNNFTLHDFRSTSHMEYF